MARAQPTFFWRYILAELWRLIALSTGVLVAVIAFAAAIKPLADGRLTPTEAVKFMGLAVVPMLQYALPFAAGFAATLAYHRLSHDNELLAAYAGGISHRSVLAPAAISGVILSLILLVLLEVAIPRFLRGMERLITLDVAKMLVNSIERGQALNLQDKLVYADRATRLTPAPDSRAQAELALWGVAAALLDKQGRVVSEVTAASGRVWIFANAQDAGAENASGRSGLVAIRLHDALFMDAGKTLAFTQELPLSLVTPPGLSDNPKYLTYWELDELHRHPEKMDWIEQRRFDLAVHLGEREATAWMERQLREKGAVTFVDDDGRRLTVRASGMRFDSQHGLRWELLPAVTGGAIEMELVRDAGDATRPASAAKLTARSAGIYTDIGGRDRTERRLTMRLEADGVTTEGAVPGGAEGAAGERSHRVMQGLVLSPDPTAELTDGTKSPAARLLAMARERTARPGGDDFVAAPAAELEREIRRLNREVTSKQNERMAAAAACTVMVVSGAVTAVTLSQSLPLTVYLWSFFPALATTILISSGQQLAHDKGPVGLVVLWGGVVVLGAYALLGYWRLARH